LRTGLTNWPAATDGSALLDASADVAGDARVGDSTLGDDFPVAHAAVTRASAQMAAIGRLRITP